MAEICPTFPRVGHVESANFLRQSTDVFQVSTRLGVAIYCFMFRLLYVGLLVCMSVSLSVWQFVRLFVCLLRFPPVLSTFMFALAYQATVRVRLLTIGYLVTLSHYGAVCLCHADCVAVGWKYVTPTFVV